MLGLYLGGAYIRRFTVLLNPKLNFDSEQRASPVRRNRTEKMPPKERKKESNKSIQNKMCKRYAECNYL